MRRQILIQAEHQFIEGDALHWWHKETGRGIRTRFSDDLLWLVYVVCEYINFTGDCSIGIPGSTSNTFTPNNIKVVISGNGALYANSNGRTLNVGQTQTIVAKDIRITLGTSNGLNNNSLVYVAGNLDLRGNAEIWGNISVSANGTGGGVNVDSTGVFTMWDDSKIDTNDLRPSTTGSGTPLYGAGVYTKGTFIMRDNSQLYGNRCSDAGNLSVGMGGGVYVNNTTGAIFRIAGGWITNTNSAGTGARLYVTAPGIAEYGKFNGDTWVKNGDLVTTSGGSIQVIDGVLQ